MDVVKVIESQGSASGKPSKTVTIKDSGELPLDSIQVPKAEKITEEVRPNVLNITGVVIVVVVLVALVVRHRFGRKASKDL
jgi:hypothetical protein